MKTFSVKEIIEYAIRIERESFEFYNRAYEHVDDPDVKDLTVQLAGEEVDHQNRLRDLIDEDKVDADLLMTELEIDTAVMDRIVSTSVIPSNATAMKVLEIALERENNTERTYAMLMSMTQITDDVIAVFEDLRKQEQGHAKKIQLRLGKLTK